MPQVSVANKEKTKVLRQVEDILGVTHRAGSGQGFTCVNQSKTCWFHILFSKAPYWHGIRPGHLEEAAVYPKAYFLFVMNSDSCVLVIPITRIADIIRQYCLQPKGSNEYQFHIKDAQGLYHFKEAGGEDLSQYYNNYASLTAG